MGLPPHHVPCLDHGLGALVELNRNTRMYRTLSGRGNLHGSQRFTDTAELIVVLSANENNVDGSDTPVVYVLTTLGASCHRGRSRARWIVPLRQGVRRADQKIFVENVSSCAGVVQSG